MMAVEARDWYRASKRCYKSRELSPGRFESFDFQAAVCNAYSIEVYIKAMLVIEDIDHADLNHDLYKLFMNLPAPLRDTISAEYAAAIPHTDNVLEVYMKRICKRFVKFRYLYEQAALLYPNGGTIADGTNWGVYWTTTEVFHNTLMDLDPRFKDSDFKKFNGYSMGKRGEDMPRRLASSLSLKGTRRKIFRVARSDDGRG